VHLPWYYFLYFLGDKLPSRKLAESRFSVSTFVFDFSMSFVYSSLYLLRILIIISEKPQTARWEAFLTFVMLMLACSLSEDTV
jgi:hypothetical protein